MSNELTITELKINWPALPITQLDNFAITTMDAADLAEIFEANFAGDQISAFDLTQIRVGRGGTTLWDVAGKNVESLDGVILYFRDARALYEADYNENQTAPPDCSSQDGKIGNGAFGAGSAGNPSGFCATCPMARFGTATKDGKRTRGQACAQSRLFFVLLSNTLMPVCIKTPPTSRKAVRKFSVDLMNERIAYWKCATNFTLVKEQKSGYPVAIAKLRATARLAPEILARVEEMRAGMMPFFQAVKIEPNREPGEEG